MPISNTPLTREQFEFLQQNITDQVMELTTAGTIAQSGLHYVVLLQVDAPEVDLVTPFYSQLQRTEALNTASVFLPTVSALNLHAVTRGSSGTTTLSDGLNQYLTDNAILVSSTYANLSAQAGFIIDPCNIDPGTVATCPAAVDSPDTASGQVAVLFSYIITAKGALPITFGVSGTLPVGVTFDGVHTISGTPAGGSQGTYSITLSATNVNNITPDTEVLTLTIAP
jgi:hypothetical protein